MLLEPEIKSYTRSSCSCVNDSMVIAATASCTYDASDVSLLCLTLYLKAGICIPSTKWRWVQPPALKPLGIKPKCPRPMRCMTCLKQVLKLNGVLGHNFTSGDKPSISQRTQAINSTDAKVVNCCKPKAPLFFGLRIATTATVIIEPNLGNWISRTVNDITSPTRKQHSKANLTRIAKGNMNKAASWDSNPQLTATPKKAFTNSAEMGVLDFVPTSCCHAVNADQGRSNLWRNHFHFS